ncbi:acyl-CoA dehydrogenase family protein [Desertimonas flava]|uniref:acyl-CoA dehydrogenase family protein n=1 Tax=Desertimonas flava TaxID=2064846 RepID=UPI000E3571FB|nr:acyl-CoA dehydrogenase [Desertimonas flava]
MLANPRAVDQSDVLDAVVDGLRSFLRAEVIVRHRQRPHLSETKHQFERSGRFTSEVLDEIRAVRQASAEAGYYAMLTPVELGGGGLGYEALYRVWEAIYRECGSLNWLGYWSVAHWARGPSQVLLQATDHVRSTIVPALLAGTQSMCFAMSEPDAGSDAWMMASTAERTDGGWVLSGTKQWVTNGPYADYALVFAVIDREAARSRRGGVGAFLVPTNSHGFRVDSVIEMFGHPGGDEAILSLDQVFVPDDFVVGEIGDGMRIAMSGVSSGRLYNSARSVGLARWAVAMAAEYAEQRKAFGRSIIEFQAVSHRLADAVMEISAARLLGIECARRLDRGATGRTDLAIAKAYSTEMAARAIDTAVQAHGAMGFTNELGLAEAWQQVRRIRVADGSAEILREQIVKGIRRGELEL